MIGRAGTARHPGRGAVVLVAVVLSVVASAEPGEDGG